ncbi:hypothetical protein Tco_0514790 [Tanacetum coccineum]
MNKSCTIWKRALPEAPPTTTTVAVRNTYTLKQAEQELFETVMAFHACKQEEGQSVSTYMLKMKAYLDQMHRLGYLMPLVLGTILELHDMLKLAEKSIPKKVPAVLAIRQGKIQKPKLLARGKGKNKLVYDLRVKEEQSQYVWHIRYREYDLAHLKLDFEFSIYRVWKSVQYGVSNGLDTAYWGFLRVGTTFDIFQNIILYPYLEYGVLSPLDTAYWSLSFCGLW